VPGEAGAEVTRANDAGESGKPIRVNRRATAPAAPRPEAVITTAEIPRVSPAPRPQFAREDGWHPDIERRLPAPWGLEIAVWVLFVLFVLGLIGLAAEHFHPSWVAFLRNTAATTPRRSSRGSTSSSTRAAPRSSTTQPTRELGQLVLVSTTRSSATYSVPTSTGFSVAISTTHPCWTQVKSPPASSTFVFARTITANQSPVVIKLAGPASLMLGAHATALTVEVGSKVIGSISPPRSFLTYVFRPVRH
jgi:hypothetical protein